MQIIIAERDGGVWQPTFSFISNRYESGSPETLATNEQPVPSVRRFAGQQIIQITHSLLSVDLILLHLHQLRSYDVLHFMYEEYQINK